MVMIMGALSESLAFLGCLRARGRQAHVAGLALLARPLVVEVVHAPRARARRVDAAEDLALGRAHVRGLVPVLCSTGKKIWSRVFLERVRVSTGKISTLMRSSSGEPSRVRTTSCDGDAAPRYRTKTHRLLGSKSSPEGVRGDHASVFSDRATPCSTHSDVCSSVAKLASKTRPTPMAFRRSCVT